MQVINSLKGGPRRTVLGRTISRVGALLRMPPVPSKEDWLAKGSHSAERNTLWSSRGQDNGKGFVR